MPISKQANNKIRIFSRLKSDPDAVLETLVDPLWRLIGSEDDDRDQHQAQEQGKEIFSAEKVTRHLSLLVPTSTPLTIFLVSDQCTPREIQIL